MRAKDLNTLEAFLAEYSGAASGQEPPLPGNKSTKPLAPGEAGNTNAKREKEARDAKAAGLPDKKLTNTELQAKSAAGDLSASDDDVGISPGSTDATDVAGSPDIRSPAGAQGLAPTTNDDKSSITGNRVSESDTLDTPNIDVGDEVKVGKFKNRKATVTGFEKDSHGQPVLKTDKGDHQLFKPSK
jgi:hypothetical protein